MKKDLHPQDYRDVVFEDLNSGKQFVVKSCAKAKETAIIDGNELPLIKIHVSSDSHPYYTGDIKLVDTEGRVESFQRKVEAANKRRESQKAKASKKLAKPSVLETDPQENSTPHTGPKQQIPDQAKTLSDK